MHLWWPLLPTLGLICCVGTVTGGPYPFILIYVAFEIAQSLLVETLASLKYRFLGYSDTVARIPHLKHYIHVLIVRCIIQNLLS